MVDQAEGLRNLVNEQSKIEKTKIKKTRKKTKIISIASGKGGVGKSNLSLNLALALADLEKKVLLLDADLGLANINIMLGIIPKFNLYHVMKGKKKFHEIIMKVPHGIDIIAGASGFSDLANLDTEMRKIFIRSLNSLEKYDYIIIDTAAGVSANVLGFVQASNEVIIITTPEPTAITDAYGIIKTIVHAEFTDIRLVINRVKSIIEGKKVSDRIIQISKRYLDVDLKNLGYLFEDPSLPKAVRKQEPVIRAFPNAQITKSFRHIAEIIDNRINDKNKQTIKSFFRKFLRPKNKKNLI